MSTGKVCVRGLSLMILSASLNMPSRVQETQTSNLQTLMPGLNLMPVPANVQMGSGSLKINAGFNVMLTGHSDARLEGAVKRFLDRLGKQTGLLLQAFGLPLSGRVTLVGGGGSESQPVQ